MIHFLHGENTTTSRVELNRLREQYTTHETIYLDGKRITETDFIQATQTGSLFTQPKLVIIENLFSKRSREKLFIQNYMQLMKRVGSETHLIFYEETEMSKSVLNELPPKTDIALFRPDANIFQLLDQLRPGNGANVLDLFEKGLRRQAAEITFALLVRQLRLLLMAKDLGKNVPELAPWQASKIARQSQLFETEQLTFLYSQLLEIDVRIKSGSSALNLDSELRMFLINL